MSASPGWGDLAPRPDLRYLWIMQRWILVAALFVLASPSCDDDCEDAAYYVAGTWSSAFHCSSTGPDGCFTGTDVITIMQAGDTSAPAREVRFTDDAGGRFEGTLCGKTFSWSGTGTGYAESGTWTFSSADAFSKSTAFENDDGGARGCCAGDGVRQGASMTPAPPAMCPPATCL